MSSSERRNKAIAPYALADLPYRARQPLTPRLTSPSLAALAGTGKDVLINLVEVAKENWSFGNGAAQYVS